MFTGLIEGLGEVVYLRRQGGECRFGFKPPFNAADLVDGESIAINGACLSVESHDQTTFTAYASGETMSRTNLGGLTSGKLVNMERALLLGQRLGGHMVSGHVDCLATVGKIRKAGASTGYVFNFPEQFGPAIIPKGSVCLDGISLTVNSCGKDYLEVNIIPDTLKRTTAEFWQPGYKANMETDIIGKYVSRYMRYWTEAGNFPGKDKMGRTTISREFLGENGFL